MLLASWVWFFLGTETWQHSTESMVILHRKWYSNMAYDLKIIYCNLTPLSHQDSDWDPSTFMEQEMPQIILREKKLLWNHFIILSEPTCICLISMHSVKFKDLSRLLGKARIWWDDGFSKTGKRLLKKLHFFWWRRNTGYGMTLCFLTGETHGGRVSLHEGRQFCPCFYT